MAKGRKTGLNVLLLRKFARTAQVHFCPRPSASVRPSIPSSIASIRFPCQPARTYSKGIRPTSQPKKKKKTTTTTTGEPIHTVAARASSDRSNSFALVRSLRAQAHSYVPSAKWRGVEWRDRHILTTGSAYCSPSVGRSVRPSVPPPLLRHMSSPWKGEWLVAAAASVARRASSGPFWLGPKSSIPLYWLFNK